MQILGVAGRAGAGKSTLCKIIACKLMDEEYGEPKIISFAGPLREAAAILGAAKTERPALYRKLCQVVGTDIMRNPDFVPGVTGPEYWCNMMNARLLSMQEDENEGKLGKRTEYIVLIDDVRMIQEVTLLRRWGATLIFLDSDRRMKDLDAEFRKHESEFLAEEYTRGRLPNNYFDYVLTNYGNVKTFRSEVEKYVYRFMGWEIDE